MLSGLELGFFGFGGVGRAFFFFLRGGGGGEVCGFFSYVGLRHRIPGWGERLFPG